MRSPRSARSSASSAARTRSLRCRRSRPSRTFRRSCGVRAAGLQADLVVAGDQRPLLAGTDLTAYRVVQEALTAAIEGSAAGAASVAVRYGPQAVEVEVVDDAGGRRALTGVRERVELYGGELHAGPRRGGGHAVLARLPAGGSA
jgi:signal transduction histidine kinase